MVFPLKVEFGNMPILKKGLLFKIFLGNNADHAASLFRFSSRI